MAIQHLAHKRSQHDHKHRRPSLNQHVLKRNRHGRRRSQRVHKLNRHGRKRSQRVHKLNQHVLKHNRRVHKPSRRNLNRHVLKHSRHTRLLSTQVDQQINRLRTIQFTQRKHKGQLKLDQRNLHQAIHIHRVHHHQRMLTANQFTQRDRHNPKINKAAKVATHQSLAHREQPSAYIHRNHPHKQKPIRM